MVKPKSPRHGSMQFWPRKRAKKLTFKIDSNIDKQGILAFAGYKVGMTHALLSKGKSTKKSTIKEIQNAVTVIECPPLKVAGVRFYKDSNPVSQIFSSDLDKNLAKKISLPKKQLKNIDDIKDFDDLTLIVYTQPKLLGIGNKKPNLFEIGIGGKKEEMISIAKEKIGKEITISEVFKPGEILDTHSVTKGKGFQGPVKRFGIGRTSHKSEKHRKNPGSLGGWTAQGHIMYRIAHAGQTGYHRRVEHNKLLLKIGTDPTEINQKGGFVKYGLIKNNYLLIKGSVGGARKRLITLSHASRAKKTASKDAPDIKYVSKESKQ